jgi:hypothetical protein
VLRHKAVCVPVHRVFIIFFIFIFTLPAQASQWAAKVGFSSSRLNICKQQ